MRSWLIWALVAVALLAGGYMLAAPYIGMLQDGAELQRLLDPDSQQNLLRTGDNQPLPLDESIAVPEAASTVARSASDSRPPANPDRNAYFGDLHVHTTYSMDAYAFGTTAGPDDAYRFARGESIEHPLGFQMQLTRPLDFYGVTDHAMFLGLVRAAGDTSTEFSKYPVAKVMHNLNAPDNKGWTTRLERSLMFANFVPNVRAGLEDGSIDQADVTAVAKSAWQDIIRSAEEFNDPGEFTTFVAYEYTSSSDDFGNLHRNVIFKGADRLPVEPFSRFHSQNPEGLWDWMDNLREQGVESLAIPHNPNGSNGEMFKLVDWAGNPMDDAYAEQRMRNEPLVEITQVKGTSDTHPLLSPNDEWADHEIVRFRVGTTLESEPDGSYVRQAYLRGMGMEEEGTVNPYKFGLIGSSDTHVAASSVNEDNYWSKVGLFDGSAEGRGSIPVTGFQGAFLKTTAAALITQVEGRDYLRGTGFEAWSASGLTGVWAEENTREAIYAAFRRKETFATSGPRIKVRFFAGYEMDESITEAADLAAQAYAGGVAMGTDLLSRPDGEPGFLVWAVKDPEGAPLQRLQVIKGYVRNGEHNERVYDVACSDGMTPDPQTHRCPDNGAEVNLADCSISANKGASELKTLWRDPDFDAGQEAFYYVRVLENPKCRWSTWDAVKAGVEPRADLKKTIQDRAWSSPIWYVVADAPVDPAPEAEGEETP